MSEFSDVSIESVIEEKGFVVAHPIGLSMRPFIKRGDTVVIKKYDGNLSVGDCVLFKGKGDKLVLHRVVKIKGETVLTRGDFEKHYDPPFTTASVLGVLTEFYSGEKPVSVSDQKYIKRYLKWNGRGRAIRLFFYRGIVLTGGLIKRVFRKIFPKKEKTR